LGRRRILVASRDGVDRAWLQRMCHRRQIIVRVIGLRRFCSREGDKVASQITISPAVRCGRTSCLRRVRPTHDLHSVSVTPVLARILRRNRGEMADVKTLRNAALSTRMTRDGESLRGRCRHTGVIEPEISFSTPMLEETRARRRTLRFLPRSCRRHRLGQPFLYRQVVTYTVFRTLGDYVGRPCLSGLWD